MKIYISDLTFEAIIGILEFERQKPQKIIIDFEAFYEYESSYLNYAEIVEFIKNEIIYNQYGLLEDACIDLSKKLKKKFNEIKNLKIKITKPDIIIGTKVSIEWNV